ncbi:MAG: YlbF family regulator [Eggerthia catenaformis]|uniref:YlbF family regulator n=1 Tax=Eggerthia catenaformis TaxID=31973 RepID=UPI00047BC85E|nr:YlbF family regulator [Eggerthia catenaformis]
MDYDLLEQLIESIKQEQCYQDFMKAKRDIDSRQNILLLISRIKEKEQQYQEMMKYKNYISLDDLKEEIRNLKISLYSYNEVIVYNSCLKILNNRLDEISNILFNGVSDELVTSRIGKIYESYFRKV